MTERREVNPKAHRNFKKRSGAAARAHARARPARGARAPEEEVVGVGREAAMLKQAQQVVVLPVHVPHNLDGGLELEQRRLVDKDLRGLVNDPGDLVGGEGACCAGLLVPQSQQLRYQPVDLCAIRGHGGTCRFGQRSRVSAGKGERVGAGTREEKRWRTTGSKAPAARRRDAARAPRHPPGSGKRRATSSRTRTVVVVRTQSQPKG